MSPRKYRQTARQASAEATRQRIVEAAAALHTERGILATSMKDIAERADVGAGTLYHHFATLDDVVRACGAHMRVQTRPPDPALFAAIADPAERVRRLVREMFAWYGRYPAFERPRCDQDRLPVLAEAVARRDQYIEALVRAALGPAAEDAGLVRLVLGLTDFAVYRTLTRGGVPAEAAAAQLAEVLLTWLATRGAAAGG